MRRFQCEGTAEQASPAAGGVPFRKWLGGRWHRVTGGKSPWALAPALSHATSTSAQEITLYCIPGNRGLRRPGGLFPLVGHPPACVQWAMIG